MAVELVKTIRAAELFTKTGRSAGMFIPREMVLEVNWEWPDGDLKGLRRIESGEYVGFFVKGVDVQSYIEPEPEPDPGESEYIIHHKDGVDRKFIPQDPAIKS